MKVLFKHALLLSESLYMRPAFDPSRQLRISEVNMTPQMVAQTCPVVAAVMKEQRVRSLRPGKVPSIPQVLLFGRQWEMQLGEAIIA